MVLSFLVLSHSHLAFRNLATRRTHDRYIAREGMLDENNGSSESKLSR